jgi:hypothetical protein
MDTQSQTPHFYTRHREHKTKHSISSSTPASSELYTVFAIRRQTEKRQPHRTFPVWSSWSKCTKPKSMLHENHGVSALLFQPVDKQTEGITNCAPQMAVTCKCRLAAVGCPPCQLLLQGHTVLSSLRAAPF